VFPEVLFRLSGIPLKSNFYHIYIVFTIRNKSRGFIIETIWDKLIA